MMYFDNIIRELEEKESKLLEIKNPQDILAATVDVDMEMHKLAYNIKILSQLKRLAGEEAVRLEREYNKRTMEKAKELTEEQLKAMGIVRSDRFKLIKTMLYDEYADLENMRVKAKYFGDMRDTYIEWIMVYKKTRGIENDRW